MIIKSDMKKSILVICTVLAVLSLAAIGNKNWSDSSPEHQEALSIKDSPSNKSGFSALNFVGIRTEPIDLLYKVDSRFMATISKEDLLKATSVLDIIPREAEWSKVSFLNMKVAILQEEDEIRAMGENEILNAAQTMLLQSTDYSIDFYIEGRGKNKDGGPHGFKDYGDSEYNVAYYFTVIPEKEAAYIAGYDSLISYLKEGSQAKAAIITREKLQPCRVNFTVTKTGAIDHVSLGSTSGYSTVDEALIELIGNMSGKWNPATNSQGEKVDQELVFFFGHQGC